MPSLVLTFQLVTSALFVLGAAHFGVLQGVETFERDKILAFLPVVFAFLAAIFCNAKARAACACTDRRGVAEHCIRVDDARQLMPRSRRAQVLEHANVEFFVVLRSSSPLLVALADWRFLGRELPDARNTGILLFILLGALGFVQQDPTVSAGAAAWGATWLCVFTFDQCFIKHGAPPRCRDGAPRAPAHQHPCPAR